MSSALTAVGVAGGVLLLVTLTDIFVAVFNYDGFTFLTARIHRMAWCGLRGLASLLPAAIRDTGLSVASAAMLPATLAGWLALEITAFAMMYLPGMAGGSFRLRNHLPGQIGTAYYFSAGDITSLTFGDVVAGNGIYRALTDEYTTTVRRLQRSFVGPPDDLTPAPLPEAAFSEQYRRARPADPLVAAFRSLGDEAREASGLDDGRCSPQARAYERYREWLPFHCRRRIFIDRVSAALGYPQSAAS